MKAFDGIPAALLLLRQTAGLTQVQLAEKSGLDPAMLSRYERGVRLPALSSLDDLLGAMEMTVGDLATALDTVNGKEPSLDDGEPRMRWVSALLLRPHFEVEALASFLFGLSPQTPADRADFVASVAYAARSLADAALRAFDEQMDKAASLRPRDGGEKAGE